MNKSEIIKKILVECEPLISDAVKREDKRMKDAIVECKNEVESKFEFDKYPLERFTQNDAHPNMRVYELVKNFILRKGGKYFSFYFTFLTECIGWREGKISTDKWGRYHKMLKDYEFQYRIFMTDRLESSLEKYVPKDVLTVDKITLNPGNKGYELYCEFTDKQKKKIEMRTRAIGAGGYNIQQFHYRYITHLSISESLNLCYTLKEAISNKLSDKLIQRLIAEKILEHDKTYRFRTLHAGSNQKSGGAFSWMIDEKFFSTSGREMWKNVVASRTPVKELLSYKKWITGDNYGIIEIDVDRDEWKQKTGWVDK